MRLSHSLPKRIRSIIGYMTETENWTACIRRSLKKTYYLTLVYAELKVYDKRKSTEGFAAEYTGTYEVAEVTEIKPLNSSAGQ